MPLGLFPRLIAEPNLNIYQSCLLNNSYNIFSPSNAFFVQTLKHEYMWNKPDFTKTKICWSDKVGCFKDEFKNYLEMHVAVLMGLLCMKVLCDFPKKKLAPISSVGFVQKL